MMPSDSEGEDDETAVEEMTGKSLDEVVSADRATAAPPPATGKGGGIDGLDDLGTQLDPRFTFKSFVVGKPNEFAYAAANRVADADVVSFNPLFLYGGVGLGRTHLMHAIAHQIRERAPQRRVLYLSANSLRYEL